MGTIISLDIAGMGLDWSKSSKGVDHGAIFAITGNAGINHGDIACANAQSAALLKIGGAAARSLIEAQLAAHSGDVVSTLSRYRPYQQLGEADVSIGTGPHRWHLLSIGANVDNGSF